MDSTSNLKVSPEPPVSHGFDILEKVQVDKNVHGVLTKIGVFLLEFLLDLFVVFPLYLVKMCAEAYQVIKEKYEEDNPKDFLKYAKIAGAYFLDIVLPLSVVGIMLKTIKGNLSGSEDVYFIWQENCFVFFISFILLISYLVNLSQGQKEEFSCSFRYLMRQEHLETLGLGVIHSNLLKQLKIPQHSSNNPQMRQSQLMFTQDQLEFNQRILQLSKNLNVDLTLFFFDLLDNKLSKSTTQRISKEEIAVLAILKETGVQVKLSARDKILWPIYEKSTKQLQQESAPLMVFFFIICLKVVLPLWYLVHESKMSIEWMSILNISGFYIYMISILYTTMNNEDLKRRNKIVEDVNKLCDFKNIQESEFIKKLDVTCSLSLETWDNARRIVCQLDQENTEKFELSYIFLGFYYIFLGLICVSIYGEIFILIDKTSVYLHPLMVIHTTADFVMVTIFFFIRIWYGTQFNSNFETQIEIVDELIGINDDLIQMYDTYFSDKFQDKVGNPLYKKMIQQIIEKSRIYTVPSELGAQKKFRGKVYLPNQAAELQIKIIKLNIETLEKIKNQIHRDEKAFKHKMFGQFEFTFKEALTTALFGFVTCAPTIFNKLQGIFSPEIVEPPKQLFTPHLHGK